MTLFLHDVQAEIPFIINRFRMNDAATATYVTDDIGGFVFPRFGTPSLGLTGTCRFEKNTCALGGVGALPTFTAGWNHWQSQITGYIASPCCIEGITAAEPSGATFYLFNSPGIAQLSVTGTNVTFSIWDNGNTIRTLTANGVLPGRPSLVAGVYDAAAQLQSIYVDGVLQGQQALNVVQAAPNTQRFAFTANTHTSTTIDNILPGTQGMLVGSTITGSGIQAGTTVQSITSATAIVASLATTTSLTGTALLCAPVVELCAPLPQTGNVQALGQDIALYSSPLGKTRLVQHFQAFRQILPDPGHSKTYPLIGVAS